MAPKIDAANAGGIPHKSTAVSGGCKGCHEKPDAIMRTDPTHGNRLTDPVHERSGHTTWMCMH